MLRRLIRRAVRFAYLLGVQDAVAARGSSTSCIDTMGDAYPDLDANRDFVLGIVEREEGSFRTTLTRGVALLEETFAERPGRGARRRRLQAPRHLRLPGRGHPGDGGRARASASTSPASTQLMQEQRTRAKEAGQEGRRLRQPHELPADPRRPRPHRVRRPRGDGGQGHRARRRPRRRRRGVDLPRPHAVLRRERRPGRRHRRHPHRHRHGRWSTTPPTACPGSTATTPASSRARSSPARRPRPRSTSTGATPSAATTPAPTSCTGRCARCSART